MTTSKYGPSQYTDKNGNEIPLEKFDNDTPAPGPLPKPGEDPRFDKFMDYIEQHKPKR